MDTSIYKLCLASLLIVSTMTACNSSSTSNTVGGNDSSSQQDMLSPGIYRVSQMIDYELLECKKFGSSKYRSLSVSCDNQPDISETVWIFDSDGSFAWQLERNSSNLIKGTWSDQDSDGVYEYKAVMDEKNLSDCIQNFSVVGIINAERETIFQLISEDRCQSGNGSNSIREIRADLVRIN